jgi:branched-chain amino acid transport system substrate-binding protein
VGVAACVTALALLTGCGDGNDGSSGTTDGDAPQTLEFAVVAELTGKFATYGEGLRAGVDQAVADLNATGAYDFTLAPKYYDCQSDQAICVSKTRDAILTDEMPIVVGPVVSLDILPSAEVSQKSGVPHIAYSPLSQIVSDYDNTFLWNVLNSVNNQTVADYVAAKLQPGEQVAIVHASTDFGKGGADEQEAALKKAGIEVATRISHDPEQSDYTPIMVELKKVDPAFILLSDSNPADIAKLLRQSRESGLQGQWIGADAAGAIDLAGEDAIGYMVVSGWFPNNTADPASTELAKAFAERGVKTSNWLSAFAYDSIQGIAESAKSTGFTAADLKAGMSKLTGMKGKAATWTFTPENRVGLEQSQISQWDGSNYTTIWPEG